MKIKDPSEIRRVDARRTPAAREAQAAATPAGDKVSTDEQARLAAAVDAARSAAAGSRAVNLEAIQAAIRQGTFRPDPQRIADRILDDAEITAALQAMLKR